MLTSDPGMAVDSLTDITPKLLVHGQKDGIYDAVRRERGTSLLLQPIMIG